ncbi:disease resistance protein RGA5 [Lactuca sativa]|uniref:HMA domain-containing protein n=1 Tax=Lactuca sativa TaxID=4236 RepID=A0A9R1UY44_LACSA|nr:disease resistance protein RGA5 [Lactuca sativa]KAJ0194918.1 hypothetical protein LSAT_V11C700381060 [Lactuca sativa]
MDDSIYIRHFNYPLFVLSCLSKDKVGAREAKKNTYTLQITIEFTEMSKQKIVVKVSICCEKQTRKALKIAVGVPGVDSASFVGSDKDQIAVIGEGIDSVKLTTLLRKGVAHTELVSVGPAEEKKEDKESKPNEVTFQFHPYQYYCNGYYMPYYI